VGASSLEDCDESFSTIPDDGAEAAKKIRKNSVHQPLAASAALSTRGLYGRQESGLGMEVIREINATTTAEVNKKAFIDDYGVKFEIPSLYVQDAKFYKGQPEYAVYLTNYVAPQGQMQLQRHGKVNETVNIREILELEDVQLEAAK
jgi:hypothetical protein